MAKIFKRKGVWYMDFYYNGKRIRRKASRDKRTAEQILHNTIVKLEQGEGGIIQDSVLLFHFIDEYLVYSANNKKESSCTRDKNAFMHIKKYFGNIKLKNITSLMVEKYKERRIADGAKPNTINIEIRTLKAMLNKALQWKFLTGGNPVRNVKFLSVMKNTRLRYLKKSEIFKILNDKIIDRRFRTLILVFLYTGLRLSENLNTKWENNIDLKRGVLKVLDTEDWQPKDYECREIPLHPVLETALLQLRRKGSKGLLFPPPRGGKYWKDAVKRKFKRLLKRLGINNASIHTLRHTFASYLVMAGVDIVTVKELMGHSNISTTMKYAHLAPEHLKGAISQLQYGIVAEPPGSIPQEQVTKVDTNFFRA